jgi:hypothetical protein
MEHYLKQGKIMYKRVTHTITEEHFGHPMAAEIKHTLENKFDTEQRPMLGATTADKFRSDVDAYFTDFHSKLTNIMSATETGNMDSLVAAETVYFDEVDQIGKLMLPYYGIEFGERITQAFRATGLSTIGISRNLKFKTDIRSLIDRLYINFDNLDVLFNQFNNAWAAGTVKSAWVAIIDTLIAESAAIMNKDSVGSINEHTKAANLMSAFSNTFANSVIQQYPNKFIL